MEITTNYSFVVLLKNKESDTIRDAIKEIRRQLKTANNSDVTVDLVRLHSDDDASFQKHVKQYLLDEGIKQTDTGGYRPQSNSRTERRIRTLKEGVKALLTQCTGGIGIYNSLWGEALLHANHCYNRSADSSGNIPYTTLTNKPYNWSDTDLVFGQEVEYFVVKERRDDNWDTPGVKGIWVGWDPKVTNGHRVVPITWNPKSTQWDLGAVASSSRVVYDEIRYPLMMGPVDNSKNDETFRHFFETFLAPNYSPNKGLESTKAKVVQTADPDPDPTSHPTSHPTSNPTNPTSNPTSHPTLDPNPTLPLPLFAACMVIGVGLNPNITPQSASFLSLIHI